MLSCEEKDKKIIIFLFFFVDPLPSEAKDWVMSQKGPRVPIGARLSERARSTFSTVVRENAVSCFLRLDEPEDHPWWERAEQQH